MRGLKTPRPDRRRFWIPPLKKGALSRQLGISEEENIPPSLLELIRQTPVGTTIKNPTQQGKRQIRVTALLKKRAVLAQTLKGF